MLDKFNQAHKAGRDYLRSVADEVESLGRKAKGMYDNPEEALERTTEAVKEYTEAGKKKARAVSQKAESTIREPRESWGKVVESTEQVKDDVVEGLSKTASDLSGGIKGAFISNNQYAFYERARFYQGTYIEKLIRTRPAFDTTLIMGESLTQFLTTGIYNPDIIQAYEMAYPNLAAEFSLAERVVDMSPEQLVGLVNGIKGKLFEIQYVDLLNDELLPEGVFAQLSESATEPGWDIQIVDGYGFEIDVLQAKATSSVHYVQQALERYPNIDVVTTEETFLKLAEMGEVEGVINSGVSNVELHEYTETSIHGSEGVLFDHIPVISLAIVAFTSYDEMGNFDVSDFTHRGCHAYITYLISIGVMSASGIWLLGPLASSGVMGVLNHYREKYSNLDKLQRSFIDNEAYIKRVEHC
ncbi:hypothetical protein [Vibrio agarivorans]|uniref:hypothetical protein n=1 Tax=Vibrio agarivorans TaxID=153622 RepID=UPI0025B5F921|nr:hypothetical protein [Vibrio agarivorans]MDN3663365.1 hypothetical protein [Vibrio agarivorans]